MEVTGQCRLCLKQGPLRDSHFIPKAAYRLVRGEGGNPNPFVVRPKKAVQTSGQTRAHLLCHECEQRLCKRGEDTFFRNCYRGPGKFRLLTALRRQRPLVEDNEFARYAVPESEVVTVEQIGYMGVSLFWKSSAHSWRDEDGTVQSISLGSPHQENFRQYLLGEKEFPQHAALMVEVSDESNRLIPVFGTPISSKWPTHYLHWIDICGIRFDLIVGSRMPKQLKELSVFRPGQKCVLVAKRQEAMLAKDYHQLLTALSRPSAGKPQSSP
jgi:hypothetical protein